MVCIQLRSSNILNILRFQTEASSNFNSSSALEVTWLYPNYTRIQIFTLINLTWLNICLKKNVLVNRVLSSL